MILTANLNKRDPDGRVPFATAAKYGRINMIKAMMEGPQGSKITKDTLNRALLENCGGETNFAIAKMLVQKGADPNALDKYVTTSISTSRAINLSLTHIHSLSGTKIRR